MNDSLRVDLGRTVRVWLEKSNAKTAHVLQKFDYPVVLDADWVNKSMTKKWRDYKVELKAEYYDENRTVVENTRVVPRGVMHSD